MGRPKKTDQPKVVAPVEVSKVAPVVIRMGEEPPKLGGFNLKFVSLESGFIRGNKVNVDRLVWFESPTGKRFRFILENEEQYNEFLADYRTFKGASNG